MYEEFGTLINRGFYSWVRNLNICIPFVLNMLFNIVLYVLFAIALGILLYQSAASLTTSDTPSDAEAVSILWHGLSQNLLLSAAIILSFLLIVLFTQSFFTAGAIGMAKKAAETGDTVLPDMIVSGSKNAFRLFLINIMVALLLLAGIVFMVPGALAIGNLSILIENLQSLPVQSEATLVVGMVVWGAYIIFLTVVLSITQYALVIDELEPLEALSAGFRFFMEYKKDVLLVWMIFIGMASINTLLSKYFSPNILVSGLTILLSIAVIEPLRTVFFTRLYESRKGKKLYDPAELLGGPDGF